MLHLRNSHNLIIFTTRFKSKRNKMKEKLVKYEFCFNNNMVWIYNQKISIFVRLYSCNEG